MGKKVNTIVKGNFDFYLKLCKEEKTFDVNPIELNEEKASHKKTNTKFVDVVHITLPNELLFCVESDKTDAKNFKFKLWCKDTYNQPFFRFDSDGLAHKNTNPDVPLEEQSITTPHFHAFDKDGREYAYKTEHLKDANEEKAIVADINFAAAHFCVEANLKLKTGDNIEIIQTSKAELPFAAPVEEDPLRNVTFD